MWDNFEECLGDEGQKTCKKWECKQRGQKCKFDDHCCNNKLSETDDAYDECRGPPYKYGYYSNIEAQRNRTCKGCKSIGESCKITNDCCGWGVKCALDSERNYTCQKEQSYYGGRK